MNYTQIAELALVKHYRKENEDLKNKLLDMRCEASELADDLEQIEPRLELIIARLRELSK